MKDIESKSLDWKASLVQDVAFAFAYDSLSRPVNLGMTGIMARAPRIHLACMLEPWASLIASGKKGVESRWGKVPCAPHDRVGADDLVIWKRSGGPVYGASLVTSAQTIPIADDDHARELLSKHRREIMVDYDEHRNDGKKWLTLIRLGPFVPLPSPVKCGKKGRSGWDILQERT